LLLVARQLQVVNKSPRSVFLYNDLDGFKQVVPLYQSQFCPVLALINKSFAHVLKLMDGLHQAFYTIMITKPFNQIVKFSGHGTIGSDKVIHQQNHLTTWETDISHDNELLTLWFAGFQVFPSNTPQRGPAKCPEGMVYPPIGQSLGLITLKEAVNVVIVHCFGAQLRACFNIVGNRANDKFLYPYDRIFARLINSWSRSQGNDVFRLDSVNPGWAAALALVNNLFLC
jgi:hypothetical protein